MKRFMTCVAVALASLSVHAEVDMGRLLGTLVRNAAQAAQNSQSATQPQEPTPALPEKRQGAGAPIPSAPDKADWAVLFRGWESGCETTGELDRLFTGLGQRKVVLPEAYRKLALGKVEYRNLRTYIRATLTISGTYHGVPVKRIVHEFGEDEFNEMSLELDAPKAVVQAALHGVRFLADPNSGLRAVVEYQPQRIRVLCDHSL